MADDMDQSLERFSSFRESQDSKYKANFGEQILIDDGTAPSKIVEAGVGGYAIVFRHPDSIMEPITEFAARISRVVPAVTYDGMTIHTTFAGKNVPGREFKPDTGVLEEMCDVVRSVIASGMFNNSEPWIRYTGDPKDVWLYNSDSVIVAGNPNKTFVDVANALYEGCVERSLNFDLAWGAHITAARFTHKQTLAKLVDFLSLIKTAPRLEESKMACLDIAHFDIDKDGVKVEVYERFE